MKATTFVLRQHQRIRERVGLLASSAHVRGPMVVDVVEEILSFLALEEDLFYPAIGVRASFGSIEEELARVQEALVALLGTNAEDVFAGRIRALQELLVDHAENDREVVRLAERALSEPQLEDLGAKMARSYRDTVGSARGAPGSEENGPSGSGNGGTGGKTLH